MRATIPDPSAEKAGNDLSDRALESLCDGDVPGHLLRVTESGGEECEALVLSALRWLTAHRVVAPAAHCDALLAGANFLYRRQWRLEHALEAAVTAIAIATRAGLAPLVSRARLATGIVMASQDNLGGAIEVFVGALERAQQTGDRHTEQKAWNNIAGTLTFAGMHADAMDVYGRSLQMLGALAPPQARCEVWANMAYSALQQWDLKTGLEAIAQAEPMLSGGITASSAMSMVTAEATWVRLLLLSNDLEGARQHAARMPALAQRAASVRADLLARSAHALVMAHGGEFSQAQRLALALVDQARTLGANELIEQLQIGMQVADAEGNVSMGVQMLGELAVAMQALQLQAAQRMLAVIGRLRGGEHDAMLYLPGASDSFSLLESIATLPELRHQAPAGHMHRVGRLAGLIAAASGVDPAASLALERAARLHDIGCAAMPAVLMRRVGRLSPDEAAILRTHPMAGGQIIAALNDSALEAAAKVAWFHHERWDGTGFPQRLIGPAIPFEARVVAIANAFDALTHPGPAGGARSMPVPTAMPKTPPSALPIADALKTLQQDGGKAFDPALTPVAARVVLRLLRDDGNLDAHLDDPAAATPFMQAAGKVRAALIAPTPAA